MDEQQIGLTLALDESGVSPDTSSFDSRLILQKTVYLMQAAGIKLGYTFNWYLRGPYSPGLTRDAYDLSSESDLAASWVLDGVSKDTARELQSLFRTKTEDCQENARRLELLASLHYLSCRGRVNLDDVENARNQLASNDKHYSTHDISGAIAELRQFGLV